MPEKRVVLKNCSIVDPKNVSSYLREGGFAAFEKARNMMKPEQIVSEIKQSGLTGRGGAGFSCGLKCSTLVPGQSTRPGISISLSE